MCTSAAWASVLGFLTLSLLRVHCRGWRWGGGWWQLQSLMIWWPALGFGASLVAQMVKNLPAMQETHVQSLGGEDSLEKGMATHSNIAWRINGQRSLADYSPWGHKVRHDGATDLFSP